MRHGHVIIHRNRGLDALLVIVGAPVLAAALLVHGVLLFLLALIALAFGVAAVSALVIMEIGRKEGITG